MISQPGPGSGTRIAPTMMTTAPVAPPTILMANRPAAVARKMIGQATERVTGTTVAETLDTTG